MPLDVSLEARQIGVEAVYKDSRVGAVRFLPQRVYMVAHGQTGVSYSNTKFQAQSAAHVGQVAGYKSQAYAMALQLLPRNGDGLGTVPLTVALLSDAESSAPSVGDITPSGTATAAASYRVNVSEILSMPFVIPKGAINVTNACLAIGNAVSTTLGMPVSVSYAYGSPSATWTRAAGTPSNGTLGTFTTTGNPKPGTWTLTCTAEASNAGTFRLVDPDGTEISAAVTVGAQTHAGLGFTLSDGSEDFNIGDVALITVPATKVTLTSGWKGTTSNDLTIQIDGPSVGLSFALTQPTGGLIDPDPTDALAQIGPNNWETIVLNGLNIENDVALDTYQTWGEGRWSPVVKRPVAVLTGAHVTTPASAIVIPDARATDRINGQLVAPGSRNLPCVIAARSVARIARLANNVPSHDYCLQPLDGITPGPDGVQWDLLGRDTAIKGGSSTVEVIDGVPRLSNVVTFYAPEGEEPPAYRYLVDIIALQNIVYNVDLAFSSPEWAGASLVPDYQAVTEPTAKKPKMAKAVMFGLVDNLALAALISDPEYSKKNMTAVINSQNPKRLDLRLPVKRAGTTNIVDAVIHWSFFFGSAPVAA